ncbi:MAG: class I SAM-dependent methyltransferase [Candidatus Tectomicrobia bacterium]|nr:class I SAM-dependent methyltransferase [Candidatus Tectomicrobia bacterium]
MFHPRGPTWWELAVQAFSSTERGYDLLAAKFDYTPYRTPDAVLAPIMAHLRAGGSMSAALDVCCGAGAALRRLRPLCRDRVVGIDFSRGMLQVARQQLAAAPGEAAVELVRGNVMDMPFAAAFDAAVCVGALGHILPSDQPRFVSQVARALKPGGRFILVAAPTPPWRSARYWRGRGFNAAMHVRNCMVKPPFIMFYLMFPLSRVVALLEANRFAVIVKSDVFDAPFRNMQLVIGTLS